MFVACCLLLLLLCCFVWFIYLFIFWFPHGEGGALVEVEGGEVDDMKLVGRSKKKRSMEREMRDGGGASWSYPPVSLF